MGTGRARQGVEKGLARNGGLSYLQIPTTEAHASASFYKAVLGWRVEERGPGDFRFKDPGGHLIGRWADGHPSMGGSGFIPYFYVDLVAEAVSRVTQHGGAVVEAPRPEGDLTIAKVRDPSGNLIGLWQETH